jgi:hypothetical protein
MDLRRRRKQRATDRLTHSAASRVRVRAFARLAEGLLQHVGVGAGSHAERSAVEAQRLLLLLRGHRCTRHRALSNGSLGIALEISRYYRRTTWLNTKWGAK